MIRIIHNVYSYSDWRQHIHDAAELMAHTSRAILSVTSDKQMQIKTALDHLANHHLKLSDWIAVCERIMIQKIEYPFGNVCNPLDVLFYIIYGFLPMVEKLFQHSGAQNVPYLKDLGDGIEVSEKIVRNPSVARYDMQ